MSKLSRRSLVSSAVALPALAMPAAAVAAVSAGPDPIFAAIDQWKEGHAVELASFEALNAAETAFQDRRGTDDYEKNVRPFKEASHQATDAQMDATYAVFDIVPTTLAGMRAKIDFAMSADHVTGLLTDDDEDADGALRNFLETLYEAARLITQA
jgi:hypothetical protein